MRYRLLFVMFAFAASAAAGCSPAASTPFCGSANCPIQPDPNCPNNAALPLVLYPVPGATGVPVTAGSLLFAGRLPANFSLQLQGGAGPLPLTFGPAPSPLPSPRASAPAGGTLYGAPYPTLAAKTEYAVIYAFNTSSCPNFERPGSSFTTK
jgi:hypothetical protein